MLILYSCWSLEAVRNLRDIRGVMFSEFGFRVAELIGRCFLFGVSVLRASDLVLVCGYGLNPV